MAEKLLRNHEVYAKCFCCLTKKKKKKNYISNLPWRESIAFLFLIEVIFILHHLNGISLFKNWKFWHSCLITIIIYHLMVFFTIDYFVQFEVFFFFSISISLRKISREWVVLHSSFCSLKFAISVSLDRAWG